MKQKIFLTSALAMGVIAPAFAEPSNTGEFPTGGLMQEDYTYTNAATSTNMDGVYEGEVNAVAEYDIIDYIVNAGQYLPADSETVITCPAGSYCPGISGNVQYNQTTPQGIQTCPSGFGSSADGSSSNTQCYRACDINNMGTNGSISSIAHATAISGNDYYGSGTDTCEPTACVNGWHIKPGLNFADTIGDAEYYSYVWLRDGGYGENSGHSGVTHGIDFYDVPENANLGVYYGPEKGFVYGTTKCSTQQSGVFVENLPDSTGNKCWCKINGYRGPDGVLQSLNSNWAHPDDGGWNCETSCSLLCADVVRYNDFDSNNNIDNDRYLFFSSVTGFQSGPAVCEANTITINWSDASQTDIDANNAGIATYGSDIRTPVKAATKKGQTFRGWRFSKPTETNLP